MTPNTLSPRRRILPIERFAGVAPQFERTDGGWFFRHHGYGPAIRVSTEDRDAFVAAGMRSLLFHIAALPLCLVAAWLVLDRMLGHLGDTVFALIVGVVFALVGIALYVSMRANADAPARALAGRPVEHPARAPDMRDYPGYGFIVGLTFFLLFLAAIGTGRPASFYAGFASASVVLGLFLAARTWRFDRRLTPTQREAARRAAEDEARREAERTPKSTWWQLILLLVFVVLQMVAFFAALGIAVAITLAIAGVSFDAMSFGLFMIAFIPGLVLGGLLIWPLEKLCKRWTGGSAIHALDFIPAGW